LRDPSDQTDEEWALTEPLIQPAKRGGKRWTRERTLDWLGRCRRLAKDWECLNRKALACFGDRDARAFRGIAGQRPAGAAFALRRALYLPALRWNARWFSRCCTGCS